MDDPLRLTVCGHASANSDDSQMALATDSVSPTDTPFAATALRIDDACALHPFSMHKLDAGPVRLMTIAHAFNYQMAVLRSGVKSAVRVVRSWKAEGHFLSGSDIPWGQQVAVMFQIVSTMVLELPSFLADLENLRVHLYIWIMSRGDIWITRTVIVAASLQIAWRLTFMT